MNDVQSIFMRRRRRRRVETRSKLMRIYRRHIAGDHLMRNFLLMSITGGAIWLGLTLLYYYNR